MLEVASLNANPNSFLAKRIEWNGNIGMYEGRSGAGAGAEEKPKTSYKSHSDSALRLP